MKKKITRKRINPVAKNARKFNKSSVFIDKKKYNRKKEDPPNDE